MFYISTAREEYSVDANGNIGRPQLKPPLAPSGQWKLRGIVRVNNFGCTTERIMFDNAESFAARLRTMKPEDWRYKNGKAKWRVLDYDHGTNRQWGEPVTYIGRV